MMSTQGCEKQDVGYETPPICDLLTLLLKNRRPSGAYNEVWPNIYISDATTAKDKTLLRRLGITHVINAAHGPAHIDTGAHFYLDTNIEYHGVEAPDSRDFHITPYLYPTASFIQKALSQQRGGKVLVHCARGVSRSATLVLAYLMIYKNSQSQKPSVWFVSTGTFYPMLDSFNSCVSWTPTSTCREEMPSISIN